VKRQALIASAVSTVVLAALLLGGCGGGSDYYQSYPMYKDLTLILRVQTPGGFPVGGATVLIDGEPDATLTDLQLHPLGDGYPDAWIGWLCNWTSDEYQSVVNFAGDTDSFEMRVHKDGWTEDSTIVNIYDYEPQHIFIRETMVMQRLADGAPLKRAPHYAEVTGGPAPLTLQRSGKPLKIIAGTDDSVTTKQ